jgi:hypothetical protein
MKQDLLDYGVEEEGLPMISIPKIDQGLNRNTKYDLWGPIWILITFNVFLFVFGFISVNVEAYFKETQVNNMV